MVRCTIGTESNSNTCYNLTYACPVLDAARGAEVHQQWERLGAKPVDERALREAGVFAWFQVVLRHKGLDALGTRPRHTSPRTVGLGPEMRALDACQQQDRFSAEWLVHGVHFIELGRKAAWHGRAALIRPRGGVVE